VQTSSFHTRDSTIRKRLHTERHTYELIELAVGLKRRAKFTTTKKTCAGICVCNDRAVLAALECGRDRGIYYKFAFVSAAPHRITYKSDCFFVRLVFIRPSKTGRIMAWRVTCGRAFVNTPVSISHLIEID
jgi:hypothetical protein